MPGRTGRETACLNAVEDGRMPNVNGPAAEIACADVKAECTPKFAFCERMASREDSSLIKAGLARSASTRSSYKRKARLSFA